jgi:outer membrane immunogenic protein
MAACHGASTNGKAMSIRIVIGRSPPLHCKPRPHSRPANLIAAPVIVMAALLAINSMTVFAADLPVKAPPSPPSPAYNWTGCYVGVNGGGASSGTNFTSRVDPGTHLTDPGDLAAVTAAGTGSANQGGFLGGGQIGCNLQTGLFAFGVEGDADYFSARSTFASSGTLSTGDTFTVTQSAKTSGLATLRPRLGIVSDRTFIYLTGGAAFSKISSVQTYADTLNTAAGSVTASRNLTGWTVGAGWEWAWTVTWSVKVEYLFASFPKTSALGGILDTAAGTNVVHGSTDLAIQVARLGMNYKF